MATSSKRKPGTSTQKSSDQRIVGLHHLCSSLCYSDVTLLLALVELQGIAMTSPVVVVLRQNMRLIVSVADHVYARMNNMVTPAAIFFPSTPARVVEPIT